MRTSVLCFLLQAAAATALALPEIAHITEPACNSETIIITGEGFIGSNTKVKALCLGVNTHTQEVPSPMELLDSIGNPPDLPATPPAEAFDCSVIGSGERYLQARFRCLPHSWMQAPYTSAVWVGDGTNWSKPILVNRPQAQWIYPQTQAPGQPIRIFGRTFSWGHNLPSAQAVIRPVNRGTNAVPLRLAFNHHEDRHTERWCLSAWLPENLIPGKYEIFVHGNHGNEFGWSDALPIEIKALSSTQRPTVNIRDLGAKGNGLSDDTSALEKALAKASPGGTVLLPPGTYAITHTVTIPEDVVIQGSGMHLSIISNLEHPTTDGWPLAASYTSFECKRALLEGMSRFSLRDLTLRFMPAEGSALRVGKDPLWSEDVSLLRVRLETRQDFGLNRSHPYCTRPLNIVKARRFSMIRCETYGPGGVSCERKVEDSIFSQNRFITDRRWRGCGFKFWGAEHVIFEDNLLTGDTRGLVMQTHFGVNYQNFIAGNHVEQTVLGGNAGETYLVEGAGYLYESPVETADGLSLKTRRKPEIRGKAATADDCIGRFVIIANGRGLGQWRRITGYTPGKNTLQIDREWRVFPDSSSTVVVMNGLIDTVFVNNRETDCAKGLYIYGAGAINNIVDRHLSKRSMGITLMTHDDRQKTQAEERNTSPDFFNLIRDSRVHNGGGIFCSAGGRLPLEDEPEAPMANFGNRFINNEIQEVVPFSGAQYGDNWNWRGGWNNLMAGLNIIPMDLGTKPGGETNGPPRIIGNIFEDNWITGADVGAGISKRAKATLLNHNTFCNVKQALIDKGSNTLNKEQVIRKGSEYNPERGPIR